MSLNQNALYDMIPFLKRLEANNVGLEPVPGSLLQRPINAVPNFQLALKLATDASSGDSDGSLRPDFYSALVDEVTNASQAADLGGLYPHDVAMEAAIVELTQSAEAILNFARNTINPLIKDLAEKSESRMRALGLQAIRPMSVVTDTYADIWNHQILHVLVEDHQGVNEIPYVKKSILEQMSVEQSLALIKTGNSDFDAAVDELVQNLTPELVHKAVGSAFYSGVADFDLENLHFDDAASRNAYLFVYLAANRLLVDVPEGSLLSADEHRAHLTNVKAEMARRINRVIDLREQDFRNKTLVKSYGTWSANYQGSTIVVNQDVYEEWLQDGGDINVLFGAAITDRKRDYQHLLTEAQSYREAWGRQERLNTMKYKAEEASVARVAIQTEVALYIQTLPEDKRASANRALTEQLAKIRDDMIVDLYRSLRRLVCRVIHPAVGGETSDVERILVAMDNFGKENPSADPREAALVALIEVLTEWAFENIQVI